MKLNPWLLFAIVAVAAIGASIWYGQSVSKSANEGITFSEHVKGNPEATVKLVEYSDFQCPACGQFEPIVKEITEQYADKMQFEYKHFPLISIHPNAAPAARAAEAAAQQGKFWEMHDLLFANQKTWSAVSNPVPFFEGYAADIGLDVDQYKTQYKASKISNYVNDSFKSAQDLGLQGTPSFFINDQQMQFTTVDEFKAQIESALGITASTTVEAVQPSVQFAI